MAAVARSRTSSNAEDSENLATAYSRVGDLYAWRGDFVGALERYEESSRISARLAPSSGAS